MDDEVKAKLLQYVEKMEAAAGKGADFLAEQAPETVRQFLVWGFWSNAIGAAVSALIAAVLAICTRRLWRWALVDSSDAIVVPVTSGAIAAGFAISAVFDGFAALKIAIAPNVYILETISQLVK